MARPERHGASSNLSLSVFGNLAVVTTAGGFRPNGFASPAFAGFAFVGLGKVQNLHAHCKAITHRSSCVNLAGKLRQPCMGHFPVARVAIESVEWLLPSDGWMQEFYLTPTATACERAATRPEPSCDLASPYLHPRSNSSQTRGETVILVSAFCQPLFDDRHIAGHVRHGRRMPRCAESVDLRLRVERSQGRMRVRFYQRVVLAFENEQAPGPAGQIAG
jgi:hypothetical protein